jgi:glutamyl-tRNA reductase
MSILAIGINHISAPVQLRERVAIAPDSTVDALRELNASPGIVESAILSTCNRTEIYCSSELPRSDQPIRWLHRFHEFGDGELDPFVYRHHDRHAVRHMLRVATGLDSMVLGEPEILGQMKNAYQMARSASTLGAPLERLFQHTFAVAKRVRTHTAIGRNPVSVAFTAVTLAKRLFGDLSKQTVLAIGAGETIELVARHLVEHDVEHLMVANRSLARARELADRFCGSAISLSDLGEHLAKADIIISSTGAMTPVLHLAPIQEALKTRKRRPIFIVDLAVPRDVEPAVAELNDIYLYTIDDLKEVAEQGRQSRNEAATEAEAMIDLQTNDYMGWLKSLDAAQTISEYRHRADDWRKLMLDRAHRQLAAGKPPEQVIEKLAHALTQRLLHDPTDRVRDAATRGRHDLLVAARELFGLDAEDKDRNE